MTHKSVRLYVDDVFICTIPINSVDGMISSLRDKGIKNVRVIEEQKP